MLQAKTGCYRQGHIIHHTGNVTGKDTVSSCKDSVTNKDTRYRQGGKDTELKARAQFHVQRLCATDTNTVLRKCHMNNIHAVRVFNKSRACVCVWHADADAHARVCVRVCARARARAYMRACVRACVYVRALVCAPYPPTGRHLSVGRNNRKPSQMSRVDYFPSSTSEGKLS